MADLSFKCFMIFIEIIEYFYFIQHILINTTNNQVAVLWLHIIMKVNFAQDPL